MSRLLVSAVCGHSVKFGNAGSGIDHWLLADRDEARPADLSRWWIAKTIVHISTPIIQIHSREL